MHHKKLKTNTDGDYLTEIEFSIHEQLLSKVET
jgi:hypothetical protein